MTEVWIVEEYDYGEGSSGFSEIHGVFSTREKAETFVGRALSSFSEQRRSVNETNYTKTSWTTETVAVYPKTIDSEDEE